MKNKLIIFCLIASMAWLCSCQKDTDVFIPGNSAGPGLDTVWATILTNTSPVSLLKVSLNKESGLDSLQDVSAGGTIQTREGLMVTIQPQSLLLTNGSPATGKIFAETFLIKQKGDMVRVDKPTTSNGRVLISGGEVFIRFRKENDELHLAPGKSVHLKFADAAPSPLMKLFYGDESNPERFNWIDTLGTIGLITQPGSGYEFVTSRFRWVGLNYLSDTIGTKVNITASLPVDYTNANTAVYLVFKDQRSVVGMYGDASTRKFSLSRVLTGKQVIIISITRKGTNSFYLGRETITTGATGTANAGQIVPLSPQPMSLPDIKAYLSTL